MSIKIWLLRYERKLTFFFKGVGCEVTSELIEDGKIVWSEVGSRGKKNQKKIIQENDSHEEVEIYGNL